MTAGDGTSAAALLPPVVRIGLGELRAAADQAGLVPSAASPLAGVESAGERVRPELESEAGLTTLGVVADPSGAVIVSTSRTASPDEDAETVGFGVLLGRSGAVGWWPAADGEVLVSPWFEVGALVDVVAEAVGGSPVPEQEVTVPARAAGLVEALVRAAGGVDEGGRVGGPGLVADLGRELGLSADEILADVEGVGLVRADDGGLVVLDGHLELVTALGAGQVLDLHLFPAAPSEPSGNGDDSGDVDGDNSLYRFVGPMGGRYLLTRSDPERISLQRVHDDLLRSMLAGELSALAGWPAALADLQRRGPTPPDELVSRLRAPIDPAVEPPVPVWATDGPSTTIGVLCGLLHLPLLPGVHPDDVPPDEADERFDEVLRALVNDGVITVDPDGDGSVAPPWPQVLTALVAAPLTIERLEVGESGVDLETLHWTSTGAVVHRWDGRGWHQLGVIDSRAVVDWCIAGADLPPLPAEVSDALAAVPDRDPGELLAAAGATPFGGAPVGVARFVRVVVGGEAPWTYELQWTGDDVAAVGVAAVGATLEPTWTAVADDMAAGSLTWSDAVAVVGRAVADRLEVTMARGVGRAT